MKHTQTKDDTSLQQLGPSSTSTIITRCLWNGPRLQSRLKNIPKRLCQHRWWYWDCYQNGFTGSAYVHWLAKGPPLFLRCIEVNFSTLQGLFQLGRANHYVTKPCGFCLRYRTFGMPLTYQGPSHTSHTCRDLWMRIGSGGSHSYIDSHITLLTMGHQQSEMGSLGRPVTAWPCCLYSSVRVCFRSQKQTVFLGTLWRSVHRHLRSLPHVSCHYITSHRWWLKEMLWP